ncbi:MAG: hypothetical protein BMS9Abin12_0810 [Acidimicrobiia bacterium]|nr:MAG: hypothetical protein BMS9Abin12_0810 [Acidimicrobiia bacterium]
MNNSSYPGDGPVAVAALLLFIQGAIAVALAVEAVGAAILFGGISALSAALTVAGAALTLALVARLPRRRRRTRRWIMALQTGWITLGIFDLALALALAGRGLTPIGFLIRIVLPGAIFWLLRRPSAREEFEGREPVDKAEESWELEEMWA